MGMVEAILLTIATAATPLLIAAMGELVVERSGVLNLGVEGMMLIGAVIGFGVAVTTGNAWLGAFAAIIAGALFSLLFGFLALTMVTNQVATGLALTLLGHRHFGHDRRGLCRPARRQAVAISTFPACPTCRWSASWCSARTRSSTSPFCSPLA